MAVSRKSRSTEDQLLGGVQECLDRHVQSGHHLVVGLSGGVDSVVLLYALRRLGRAPAAVHVNHGLSPSAADWARFCRLTCARWGVPLEVVTVAVERWAKDGLEAAARRARHGVFAACRADWIVLGHHLGDRAETLLFNLFRGAGVRGAAAMPERQGRLLRPLLGASRELVLQYAREQGLEWVEDESNADTRFSRNFLRHRILKPLKERFPAAEARLAVAAGHFEEACELLDALARADLDGTDERFPVEVSRLAALSEPRARNVLRYLLQRSGAGVPSHERLREALRQVIRAAPDRHPSVAFGGWVLRRVQGWLHLESDCA